MTQVNDTTTSSSASAGGAAQGKAAAAPAGHGFTFGEFLSCLNPLQYLPVVGTLYRAVTGDTIPETVREAGSLVVSGLTGGPMGVAISVGTDIAERAIGFNQEKFSQQVLASLGIGHASSNAPASASSPATTVATSAATTAAAATPLPASVASLSAAAGAFPIPAGGTEDADTLNGMELARLATTSYGRAGALGSA